MELFEQTVSIFKPFAPSLGTASGDDKSSEPPPSDDGNIDELRRQMKEMQERLDRMSKETNKEE